MNEAWEPYSGNMATTREDSLEIPNRFCGERVMLVKEAASVFLVEDTGKPPWLTCERLYIEDLNNKHVTGVSAFNFNRTGEIMHTTDI
jgi:hypothetical protein